MATASTAGTLLAKTQRIENPLTTSPEQKTTSSYYFRLMVPTLCIRQNRMPRKFLCILDRRRLTFNSGSLSVVLTAENRMQLTSLTDIESWLYALENLLKTGNCEAPTFLRPFHFVLLGMHLRRYGARNLTLPVELEGYASRMHLWEAIGCPPPVTINELDCTGRFHPLVVLSNPEKVDETSRSLIHMIRGPNTDDKSARGADNAVAELIGNCYAHSESDPHLQGLACAQSWPRGNKAQIAIGDSGVGIRYTLKSSGLYDDKLATTNACELAAEYEVTSKPGRGHSGYGLTLARDLLEMNGGALFVLSHNEWFSVRHRMRRSGTLNTPLPGTLVLLEWNTDAPLDATKVYESWPLPEGMEYDDFDI